MISEQEAGRMVKSLLEREFQVSRAFCSRLKRRADGILLNGAPCYVTARVREGDILSVAIDDRPDGHIVPMALPLSAVMEDDYLLVLDKPAGIAVHQSTRDPGECTLENAVCHYLGGNISPHPVSRLDRGTSGLILFAKSGYIHERFKRLLHTPAYARAYLGVAVGRVDPPRGIIELPIGMAAGSTYRRVIDPSGQNATTAYETLSVNERYTLLRLVPHTGRTHQLRLHMAAVGYPLAGDWLYGEEGAHPVGRPALHSHALAFDHPMTGERIALTSPLPADLRALMDGTAEEGDKA